MGGRSVSGLTARARRVWRRQAARSVRTYVAERRLAGERVDATAVRELLMRRAMALHVSTDDVDAVMREADLRNRAPISYVAPECEP